MSFNFRMAIIGFERNLATYDALGTCPIYGDYNRPTMLPYRMNIIMIFSKLGFSFHILNTTLVTLENHLSIKIFFVYMYRNTIIIHTRHYNCSACFQPEYIYRPTKNLYLHFLKSFEHNDN